MRFLSIYKTVERSVPPSQEEMSKMGKLIEEGLKDGWLLGTEGCLSSRLGARVRLSEGKLAVTDGPFTEAKEVVGGFAILQYDSLEEAISGQQEFAELHATYWPECSMVATLRQISEAPPNAADA